MKKPLQLAGALGHADTMRMLYSIGSKTGESEFVTGNSNNFGNALTPAQAKAEIVQLKQDKGFTVKLLGKDSDALNRWTQLHKYAYPE